MSEENDQTPAKLAEQVRHLIKIATEAESGDQALKYTQAALNAANAMKSLKELEFWERDLLLGLRWGTESSLQPISFQLRL